MSLKTQLESILADKRANLLPSNIRIGKTIMGVTGTLPAPAENRTVKRFESFEDMQADEAPDKDDLAIIYGEYPKDIYTASFNKINILANEITLDTEITQDISISINSVTDVYLSGRIYIRPSYIRLYINDNIDLYNVYFRKSEDTLTYVKDTNYFTGDKIALITHAMLNTSALTQEIKDIVTPIIDTLFSVEGIGFSGIYQYDGENYVAALTQFTATSSEDIFESKVAYGKTGEIVGDGSWLNKITNKQFLNNWLNGLTQKTYTGIIQTGTKVPAQTFVKHRYISADEVSTAKESDCIAYTKTTEQITKDLSGYSIVKTSYTDSMYYYTMNNNTPYYVFCGWTYTTADPATENNRGYRYAKNLFYYVVNLKTMDIEHQGSTTRSIQMLNVTTTSSSVTDIQKYYGQIHNIGYNFNENRLYAVSGQLNFGWNHGAFYKTFDLNDDGTFNERSHQFTEASNYRFFDRFIWDDVHFGWVTRLVNWASGESNTYRICYMDTQGNASIKLTGAGPGRNLFCTTGEHNDLGAIQPITYVDADDNTLVYLYDVYNGKKLSIPKIDTRSRYYLAGGQNYIYVMGKTNTSDEFYSVFKINKSNSAVTNLFNTERTSLNYMHPIMVDDEDCFAFNNTVYNSVGTKIGHYYIGSRVSISIGIEFTNTGVQDIWNPSFSLDASTYSASTNKVVEVLEIYSDIDTLPITDGNLAVVCDESAYTKQTLMSKNYARLLTNTTYGNGPLSQDEYDEALETATEILGEEEVTE